MHKSLDCTKDLKINYLSVFALLLRLIIHFKLFIKS